MADENRTYCVPGDPVPSVPFNATYIKTVLAPGELAVYPDWEIGLKVFFYILAMLLDLVGNSIVVFIIILNRKMRTTTNVLILNLAASDLMVACFCMWVHLVNQITPNWPLGAFMCKFSTFTQVMSVTASVLTLTVISVERFIAVVYPFKGHWSPMITGLIIACTWIVAISTASPHLIIRKQYVLEWKDRDQVWCGEDWTWVYKDKYCKEWQEGKFVYYLVEGIVMYFAPIGIMIAAYSVITYKLLTHKAPGSLISSTSSAQEKTKRKVTRMLIIVLVVFVICWTPQQVMLLLSLFPDSFTEPLYYNHIRYAGVFIAYFNSAMNPILYGGFNENFRKGFVEAFKCILIQKRNKIGPVSEFGEKSTLKPADSGRKKKGRSNHLNGTSPAASHLNLKVHPETMITHNPSMAATDTLYLKSGSPIPQNNTFESRVPTPDGHLAPTSVTHAQHESQA